MTTVILNNSLNSAANNPPGYNIWVGGEEHGDTEHGAVKVNKGQIGTKLKITPGVFCDGKLLTWYYDYGWYSGDALEGPFTDGQHIQIPTVSSNADELRDILFHLEGTAEKEGKKKPCLT
jgi:hypothetical protein